METRTQDRAGRPAERIQLWRLRQLDNLELMHAHFIRQTFPKHTHDGFGVGVIENGALGFYYRGAHVVAPARTISIVNPDEMHTGHAAHESGWTYRMFYFTPRVLQRAASEITGRRENIPFFKSGVLEDNVLAGIIKSLHICLTDAHTFNLEKESRFLRMLVLLILRHAGSPPILREPGREKNKVIKTIEYLNQYYACDISIRELASLADLSPFHFIRVFKKETGLTPHSYLKLVRIRKAKQLIVRGTSLADAVYETGFTDQSHFTRHFKRILGYTPGKYRNFVQDN